MPRRLEDCFVLSANISMEYEKAEVNSGFFYKNAEQREKMVAAERAITDDRVNKVCARALAAAHSLSAVQLRCIASVAPDTAPTCTRGRVSGFDAWRRWSQVIELKKAVCGGTQRGFVVINQKGIDPGSLDLLAKHGIMALRRAKRRNAERLALACGCTTVSSVEELVRPRLHFRLRRAQRFQYRSCVFVDG